MSTAAQNPTPKPEMIFETLNAYQRTSALKGAIELDVFTGIGEGSDTAEALAKRSRADARAMRILCDYLVILGFLNKAGNRYSLTADSAAFLDRRSPACMASMAGFLANQDVIDKYKDIAAVVRRGGALNESEHTGDPNNPIWIEFARSMAPMQAMVAEGVAHLLDVDSAPKWKVLDIAAGHGMYGITVASHNPKAEIYAVDWPSVLEVAKEHARGAGVEARYHTLPGNAFEVDFGSGYDLILLTGFLHHFDPPTIEKLLRKVHSSLAPGGRAVTVEFVPNEDRVSPPLVAAFAMVMLGVTRSGDAYPFSEYERMFRNAGFSSSKRLHLPMGPQSVIVSEK
ncbi:MAG TPA: class I SAM-dependent methyltransferase [Candidatus Limnocylindrales bacterium]|nr:class I SAM-dependent methyltransferase [Candidatus Limnocylindrales bacterium]